MSPPAAAPRPTPARALLRILGPLLGGVLAAALVVGLAYLLRLLHDFVADAYRTATYVGVNAPKALALAAVALVLLAAFPLALLEAVSGARFRRAERDLRQTRPLDEVRPYEGPEGRGLLFHGAEGAVLLLRPPGGLGGPRLHPLPAAGATPPEAPTPGPADGA